MARHLPGGDLPASRSIDFEVKTWLAGLGRFDPDSVRYRDEIERGGLLIVTYEGPDGFVALVSVSRFTGVATAAWQLIAELPDGGIERVVVPGGTRFVWR